MLIPLNGPLLGADVTPRAGRSHMLRVIGTAVVFSTSKKQPFEARRDSLFTCLLGYSLTNVLTDSPQRTVLGKRK